MKRFEKGKWHWKIPEGINEIESHFGHPQTTHCSSALLVLPEAIGSTSMLACHEKALDAFECFFHELKKKNLTHMIESVGRIYNEVPKATTYPPQKSLHCWGAALTLNFGSNRPDTMKVMGEDDTVFTPTHPVVLLAEELGFFWGGKAENPEPSEFILAQGY